MKIVIDVDEETYTRLKTALIINAGNTFYNKILTSVAEGTPLPKGHGDLIDRNVAYTEFENAGCSYESNILRFVPVVIKADK